MPGTSSASRQVRCVVQGYSNAAVTSSQYLTEFIVTFPCRVGGIRARGETAGSGTGNTVIDVLRNGSSIFHTSANRPTLASASTGEFASVNPDVRSLNAGDQIAIQVASVPASTGHARVYCSVSLEDPYVRDSSVPYIGVPDPHFGLGLP